MAKTAIELERDVARDKAVAHGAAQCGQQLADSQHTQTTATYGRCRISGTVEDVAALIERLDRHEARPCAPVRLGPGGDFVKDITPGVRHG